MNNDKIVICSSTSFHKEIKEWKEKLEKQGYNIIRYPDYIDKSVENDSLYTYKSSHIEHYKKISEADILFVLNLEKDNIHGYIGPSVFAEISFAIGLNIVFDIDIQIYYLNPISENLPYSDELKMWGGLGWIKLWRDSNS